MKSKSLVLVCLLAAWQCLGTTAKPLPSAQKDHGHLCQKDSDCILTNADCCGCRQGGKQRAVLHADLLVIEAEQKKQCAHKMCAQVMSKDASCEASTKATCQSGQCRLSQPAKINQAKTSR